MILARRAFCAGIAASALASPALAASRRFDAAVCRHGGTHDSLASALADAPPGDAPFTILLGRGRWQEKLRIERPDVLLIGEDRRQSILTSAVASGHDKPGGGTWGTYGSATLTVEASDFAVRNLTIENGFDYVANLRPRSIENSQAVALALGNRADRSLIVDCDLLGHQDTCYLRQGRALVRGCLIAGSVDFIFGGAAALFERCEIRSRLRPGEALQGYVAAPSTPRSQRYGLVFDRCRLTREQGVADASAYLGRPWRAGGNTELLGQAAYLRCWMGAHIHPEGWTWMGYKGPGGYPMRLEAGDARFVEHANYGPGAQRTSSRPQLSVAEAAQYDRERILEGWNPDR